MFPYSRRERPFHYGDYALERLPRAREVNESGIDDLPAPRGSGELGFAAKAYLDLYQRFRKEAPFALRAPVPDALERRSIDVKGAALFFDASMVGICELRESEAGAHTHAVVILLEHGRAPEKDNAAHAWFDSNKQYLATLRAAEIALISAGQIRAMGFAATAHWPGNGEVHTIALALRAGLLVRKGADCLSPFVDSRYALSVVTTDYALAADRPLDPAAMRYRKSAAYWLGAGGAVSGFERLRRARRATHLSRYPMETLRRRDRPTTLILDEEVPRVPVRAGFFRRATWGDLGDKAAREIQRFAYKHPVAYAARDLISSMVPLQDTPLGDARRAGFDDPAANARALKSLSYALGADLSAICEIPRYAWYSHDGAGKPVEPAHRYALVMLIDQGFDTMEGASGDDWISGAQSMRAYLRGAEIAGVMAMMLRAMGVPARAHTNASSWLLHIPLILWAGLGELSRIGELVLNPFVGPRFKSVVLSTDLPLEVDRPIDFGLQELCGICRKCARECPCDAIPYGGKIMFNGYETWKPDAERCARYRITNPRGVACGRCMKTCPLNKNIDLDAPWYLQAAKLIGVHGGPLKRLLNRHLERIDDRLGYGVRIAAKKWWLDLEIRDGVTREPQAGANQRDLEIRKSMDPARQKIAIYPAAMNPPGDHGESFPVDRKAALREAERVESPQSARARSGLSDAAVAAPAHDTAAERGRSSP